MSLMYTIAFWLFYKYNTVRRCCQNFPHISLCSYNYKKQNPNLFTYKTYSVSCPLTEFMNADKRLFFYSLSIPVFTPLNHCKVEASSLAHIHACFSVSSLIGDALHGVQQRLLVPVGAELELSPGIITELNDSHLSKRKRANLWS